MRSFILVFFCFCSFSSYAQNVGIGTTTPSNLLHIAGTANPIRIEGIQAGAPEDSLLSIDSAGVIKKRTSAFNLTGWSVTGNAGTTNSNFVGTTDMRPLLLRTNNQLSGIVDPNTNSRNNGFGYRSLNAAASGTANNAIGFAGLSSLSTGSNNTAVGDSAAAATSIGFDNTAVGSKALQLAAAAAGNVAIGANALRSNLSSENVAIGKNAALNNIGGSSILAIGTDALLANRITNNQLAIGNLALTQITGGQDNLVVGYSAGLALTNASANVLLGHYALSSAGTASRNTMVGHNTGLAFVGLGNTENTFLGFQAGLSQTGGVGNTLLGAGADVAGIGAPNNATGIGQNVQITASNQVRIGNTNVTSIGGQVGWTTFSDARIKKDVQENVAGLVFIERLRPVTYTYDIEALQKIQGGKQAISGSNFAMIRFTGLLAQEVEAAAAAAGFAFSGVDKPGNDHTVYGLRYAEFVVPLIKAVQEMKQLIDAQQKEINELKQRLNP